FNEKEFSENIVSSAISSKKGLRGLWITLRNKKFLYWGIGIVVIILIIGAGVWAYKNFKNSDSEQSVFGIFKKGESVGSASGVGGTVFLGNLRVKLYGIAEGEYRPLEVDDAGRRVTKGYFGMDVEVYNSDLNITDHLLFGLTDDLGNEYERDLGIDFYLDDIEDLGPADNFIAQTLRRGHLLFPAVNTKAKKLELTVYSKERDQKITFEIER
ncbi:MAG: hypothetical protein HYT27_01060, partial [Parcubacteria group bacterium]|nr:hypothetical protein [Parcubacteria group bacterium]